MKELLFCCVCGKRLMNMKGRPKNTKYPCCGDPYCKKEVNRRRTSDSQKAKRLIVSKERLAGIEKMKADLDTKEKFLKASQGRNGLADIARKYGIAVSDLSEYREELLADMTPSEIRALRKKVTNAFPSEFVRKKPEVKVYKITDMKAFESGGEGTYNGLEFDRIEYANEVAMPFNGALVEVE